MSERERFAEWAAAFRVLEPVFLLDGVVIKHRAMSTKEWDIAQAAWQAAAAERDALLAQVAVLREALERVLKALDDEAKSESTLQNAEANFSSTASDRRRYEDALTETSEALMKANATLTHTEAAAREYEREVRNRVLEEVAERADAQGPGIRAAQILAMKETP